MRTLELNYIFRLANESIAELRVKTKANGWRFKQRPIPVGLNCPAERQQEIRESMNLKH